MKKKKILYSIILIILIGFILTCYNAFNGNPLSNLIGKHLVENYLEETYPNEEFRVEPGYYSFKFSEYSYDVIKIGEDPYAEFNPTTDASEKEKQYENLNYYITVKGTFNPRIRYDGVRYARLDENLSTKLSEEASTEILNALQKEISNIKAIESSVEVLKFTMDESTKWSKTLPLDEPISLHIVIDSTNQSSEDALDDGVKIQQLLNELGYNYSNVTINANSFDKELGAKDEYGYVKYAFHFKPDTTLSIKHIETIN